MWAPFWAHTTTWRDMEQYDTKTKAPNIAMKILFIIDCSKLISMIMSGDPRLMMLTLVSLKDDSPSVIPPTEI